MRIMFTPSFFAIFYDFAFLRFGILRKIKNKKRKKLVRGCKRTPSKKIEKEVHRMNVSQRNLFLDSLYACLHTITCYLPVTEEKVRKIDLKELRKNECVSTCIYRSDTERLYLKLNLNKGLPGNDMIRSFNKYQERLKELMNSIGYDIKDVTVTRADLCINSNLDRSYDRYRKLLKYILCCCFYSLDLKNGYETRDPLSFTHLNLKFGNRNLEIENYNKEVESHGSVPTRNRLEMRSKKLNCGVDELPEEFKKWCERLELSLEQVKTVQENFNMKIEEVYRNDKAKTVDSIVDQYRNCIFTRSQLRDLLKRIDEKNNSDEEKNSSAKYYKSKYRIEFFSNHDLVVTVNAIKEKIDLYFWEPENEI